MDFQLICKSLFLDCNCEGNWSKSTA
jgi:hypothetical protein